MSLRIWSVWTTYSSAPSPVTASMRRTPAAIPPSLTMRNRPMSPARLAWVPPQSSVEKSPTRSTRTSSSYFSPNSAIAPAATAASYCIRRVSAAALARTSALTRRSISRSSSGVTAE